MTSRNNLKPEMNRVLSKIIHNGGIPKVLRIPKDNKKSCDLRTIGNRLFIANDFDSALLYYNQAICYARIDSEALGVAYANRSAVYFQMELFKQCSENIKLAKVNNYPQHMLPKLLKRDQHCLEYINNKPDIKKPATDVELKLSHHAIPNIPFVANCLELKCTPGFGRGVFTNRNLIPGDIVVLDDPLTCALEKELIHKRCSRCFLENRMNLIPCKGCTSAMFCSLECYEKGMKEFHKFECSTIDAILELSICASAILPLRMLWIAISAFENTNDLTVFHEMIKVDPFLDFNFELESLVDRYKLLTSFMGHEHLISERRRPDIFAPLFAEVILKDDDIRKRFNTKQEQDFLVSLLNQYAGIQDINAFRCYYSTKCELEQCGMDDQVLRYMKHVGSGLYPYATFLNHSCYPNTERAYHGNQLVLFVIRPISKGDQLFVSYGKMFRTASLQLRQNDLKVKYGFDCSCEACKKDYPKVEDTSKFRPNQSEIAILNEVFSYDYQRKSHMAHLEKIARLMKTKAAFGNPHLTDSLGEIILKYIMMACVEH